MDGRSTPRKVTVVGLGNPGDEYALNRHNLGFMALDRLAEENSGDWARGREKARVSEIRIGRSILSLVKPLTYMNLSGRAVVKALERTGCDPGQTIVAHDDMDIELGTVRIKKGGGDGGHRGVQSIADSLRSQDFIRVRMGVGRPPRGIAPEVFVLSDFDNGEEEIRDRLVSHACLAIRLIVTEGVAKAQNMLHSGKLDAESSGSEPG